MLKKIHIKRLGTLIPLLPLCIASFFMWNSCAQKGNPSGGPRDSIPPKITSMTPPNYATNFDTKTVTISFNEYIQLDNKNDALLVSPPMEEDPEIITGADDITIELNDTLRENTTYTLDFGNNIVDLHESNPLKNFRYVFSTGDIVDTLLISGYVLNAKDLEPISEAKVMLYKQDTDSLPYKEIPAYYTKTNEEGVFSITNISPGSYKIFALKDANANFLFDLSTEKIAFRDSLFVPDAKSVTVEDTIEVAVNDTTTKDSIIDKRVTQFYPTELPLFMFQEKQQRQYLDNSARPHRGKCRFIFNKKLKSIEISPLNISDTGKWSLKEKSIPNDSLIYWVTDSSAVKKDSLNFSVTYKKKDSLGNMVSTTDTAYLRYTEEQPSKDSLFQLRSNTSNNSTIDQGNPVIIESPAPVNSIDTSLIDLYKIKDSVEVPQEYKINQTTYNLRKYKISHNWEEETKYRIKAYPGAVVNIYGRTNDTLKTKFSYKPESAYGNISLKIKNFKGNGILKLLNSDESTVFRTYYFSGEETIDLQYLKPRKYLFKLIYDNNNNKKWDTGDYLKHKQPEEVIYYDETIKVKAGWESKMKWNTVQDTSNN